MHQLQFKHKHISNARRKAKEPKVRESEACKKEMQKEEVTTQEVRL
jgi:hypothetical protein